MLVNQSRDFIVISTATLERVGSRLLQWLRSRFGLREDTPVATVATSTDPQHGDALERTPAAV
jgi:hypothetical protein